MRKFREKKKLSEAEEKTRMQVMEQQLQQLQLRIGGRCSHECTQICCATAVKLSWAERRHAGRAELHPAPDSGLHDGLLKPG